MKSNWNLVRFGNILAYIIVVVVNSMAGAIGINGLQTGTISDKYATLIAPAGYVFSIWGARAAMSHTNTQPREGNLPSKQR